MRVNCPFCLQKLAAQSRKNFIKKEKGSTTDYFENSQTCSNCGCRCITRTEVEVIHTPEYAKDVIN
jgi:hypothetical protein